jgi:hypothetical protein
MSGTYDHQWDRLAKRHLRIRPVCAVTGCGKPAKHVDHVVPVAVAPHRRLDPTNLQGLCHACHNRLTAAYDKGSIAGVCDVDGLPLDPNHPWRQPDNAAAIAVTNAKPRTDPILAAQLKRDAARQAGRGGIFRPKTCAPGIGAGVGNFRNVRRKVGVRARF